MFFAAIIATAIFFCVSNTSTTNPVATEYFPEVAASADPSVMQAQIVFITHTLTKGGAFTESELKDIDSVAAQMGLSRNELFNKLRASKLYSDLK